MGLFDFLKGDDGEATDIDGLESLQNDLRAAFEKAQVSFFESKEFYQRKKSLLVDFDNKYGRVLRLIKED